MYSIYDLTDDAFAQSLGYDQLYTEMTGAVALFAIFSPVFQPVRIMAYYNDERPHMSIDNQTP